MRLFRRQAVVEKPVHPSREAAHQIVAELKAVGADLSERADQLEDVAERLNEVVQEMRANGGGGGDDTGDDDTVA